MPVDLRYKLLDLKGKPVQSGKVSCVVLYVTIHFAGRTGPANPFTGSPALTAHLYYFAKEHLADLRVGKHASQYKASGYRRPWTLAILEVTSASSASWIVIGYLGEKSGMMNVKKGDGWRSGMIRGSGLPELSLTRRNKTACCARGRPIIVEWERDARHSAGLSLVR
ncbi:hypothetical protein EVAR_16772_1 [Eumeta japonica]|uniref:Uncharacterized protein n=1 Tax=Eumeta variegata TaxID=151549 RepID=A0A4C1UM98_EUMVA|nr:hypothetical protein EVAR_16772_1 [Eumeta japonica]